MDLAIPAEAAFAPPVEGVLESYALRSVSLDSIATETADLLLVRGKEGVRALGHTKCPIPVLVVDGPPGIPSVGTAGLPKAIDAIQAEAHALLTVPTMTVATDEGTTEAVAFDVKLMTMKPAAISEFAISCGGHRVDQYRADGVVLATPMGSLQYARAGGGAVCSPTLTGLSVVPIAPYRTNPRHWVLDGHVCIRIARDEERVIVLADDTGVATLDKGDSVTCRLDRKLIICDVADARSPYTEC